MATLPLTVISCERAPNASWEVVIAFADGTRTNMLIPETLATLEAVTFSALALAVLSDPNQTRWTHSHSLHKRYDPRT